MLGQDQARGPPGGGGGSSCFSLPSSAASPLSASHPRWREHASEAGSLVHVSPLVRHSLACRCWLRQSQLRENHQIQLSAAKDIFLTRLTMADVVGIDVAVAQAAQSLQQVQHQQAALYNRMGPSTILATQTRWATTKVEQCLAQSWPLASLTSILRDRDSKRWRSASFVCEVC